MSEKSARFQPVLLQPQGRKQLSLAPTTRWARTHSALSWSMLSSCGTGNAADGDEMTTIWSLTGRTLVQVFLVLSALTADADNGVAGAASGTSNSGEAISSRLTVKW